MAGRAERGARCLCVAAVLLGACNSGKSGPGPDDRLRPVDAGSPPVVEACGDGRLDLGELCDPGIRSGAGACPATCDDGDACTRDVREGTASTCTARCLHAPLPALVCAAADGCCAPGCTANDDADCAPRCGNGVVEQGETCDGNCPLSCDDGAPCTVDVREGSETTCDVECLRTDIVACLAGDGCCPAGCASDRDSDCSPTCGNGVREAGETCDPGARGADACPADCADADGCTVDALAGSAASCSAKCTHVAVTTCRPGDGCCAPGCNAANDADCEAVCGNRAVEPGESCDGNCPDSCADADVCTLDRRQGADATCDVRCVHPPVTACASGDGCCVAGCNALQDGDCPPVCRNGVVEPGETCDGNCPQRCDDANACTRDAVAGDAALCTAHCDHSPVLDCVGGDGCCPPGCTGTRDADCGPAPPGDACADAPPLVSGATVRQALSGCGNDAQKGPGCVTQPGADRFFAVQLPARRRLTATLTPVDPLLDATLSLILGAPVPCVDEGACVAGVDDGYEGEGEILRYANTTTDDLAGFLVVDAFAVGGDGAFDLRLDVTSFEAGEDCDAPVPLAVPGTLPRQRTTVNAGEFAGGPGCAGNGEAARLFALDVPPGLVLQVVATPGSAGDVRLNLFRGTVAECRTALRACAASADLEGTGGAETLTWGNAGAAAERVWLAVESSAEGTFDLAAQLLVPAPGDSCLLPTALAAPGTLPDQTLAGALDDYAAGAYCEGTSGPDRVYSIQVPAGQRLVVSADGAVGPSPRVTITGGGCGPDAPACAQTEDAGASLAGFPAVNRWTNEGESATTAFIRIDTQGEPGTYALAAGLDVPAAGETCLTAVPLSAGAALAGQTTVGADDDYAGDGALCDGLISLDRVYRVRVPPGSTLAARVVPEASFDPTLNAVAGADATACMGNPRRCVAASDLAGDGRPEAVRVPNKGASALEVYLVVDSATEADAGAFAIETALDAWPGDTCANATALTLPASRANELLAGHGDDVQLAAACTAYGRSTERVYSVVVPPGREVVATAAPKDRLDLVLAFVDPATGCAPGSSCLARTDMGAVNSAETLRWTNSGAADATVLLVVENFNDIARPQSGRFDLAVALSP